MEIPDDFDFDEYFEKLIDERMKFLEELVEKYGPGILSSETLEYIHQWREEKHHELPRQDAGNP